jgi:hypothetical protein
MDGPLTSTENGMVAEIFRALWQGVPLSGSWKFSRYRDHGNYIRRGPLLLRGDYHSWSLGVLVPADALVTPASVNPAAHGSTRPEIEGKLVEPGNRPGSWFALLRQELPAMQQEIRQLRDTEAAAQNKTQRDAEAARFDDFADAAAACARQLKGA